MIFAAIDVAFRRLAVGAAAVILLASGPGGAGRAQDRTPAAGGEGSGPVTVDLSVIGVGSADRDGNALLFPGSRIGPGERVVLRPPGPRAAGSWPPSSSTDAAPGAGPRFAPPGPTAAPRARPPARLRPGPGDGMPAGPEPDGARTALAPPPVNEAPPILDAPAAGPPEPAEIPGPPATAAEAPPFEAADAPSMEAATTAMPSAPPAPPPVAAAPRTPVAAAALDEKPRPPTDPEPAVHEAAPQAEAAALPKVAAVAPGPRQRILFSPGSARLSEDGREALDRVLAALAGSAALRVQLSAYAQGSSGSPSQARRLSLSRALAIRSHLIEGGVGAARIDVRALGNKVPDGPPNRVDVAVVTR